MTILALEFSSPLRSVAVLRDGSILGHAQETGSRETKAFTLISRVLREANVSRDIVSRIAVGLGPGSFAGIRIAIAIARGWHIANGTQIVGFSSADSVAHQVRHQGEFTVVIDAHGGEFYGARYHKANDRIALVDPFHSLTKEQRPEYNKGELFVRPDVLEDGEYWHASPADAATLAKLGAGTLNSTAPHDFDLIHLRRTHFVKATVPRFIAD